MSRVRIGITIGDPAGIGPEIVVKALEELRPFNGWDPVVFGDRSVLEPLCADYGPDLSFSSGTHAVPGQAVLVESGIVTEPVTYGIVDEEYGRASLAYIEHSIHCALSREIDAVVTAPVNKQSLLKARTGYLDHTDIFTQQCRVAQADTMFICGRMRIFFLTRHLALRDVPAAITRDMLLASIKRCMGYLRSFGIAKPALAVAALNPHGGDGGIMGREEIDVIRPAVLLAQKELLDVRGPVPADSVFHLANEGKFDGVLSLYHDQGHIAAKTLDFYRTVSMTLGLPFLRTSVDHGTAFDIAGKGVSSAEGMVQAVSTAIEYVKRQPSSHSS